MEEQHQKQKEQSEDPVRILSHLRKVVFDCNYFADDDWL